MKFPKKKAILENAKIDFVNIDNIITASKKERASKIFGYILIKYPDSNDIILLKEGEPLTAARLTGNLRKIVPIEEAVNKAKTASTGLISVYETAPEIIRMLFSTFKEKPIFRDKDVSEVDIVKLIKKLIELKYSGFFELRKGVFFSYVIFKKGYAKLGFFQDKLAVPLSNEEFLKILLKASEKEGLKITAYKEMVSDDEQATPSAVSLFIKVITELSKKISVVVGDSLAKRTMSMAFDKAGERYDWINQFKVKGLSVTGTVIVSSKELAKGFSYLVKQMIEFYKPILGDRIDNIVKDSIKDYRFALKNMGFYMQYGMDKYEQ